MNEYFGKVGILGLLEHLDCLRIKGYKSTVASYSLLKKEGRGICWLK